MGSLERAEGATPRLARRARQHDQRQDQYWVAEPHRRRPSCPRSTWCRASATTGPQPRCRAGALPLPAARRQQPRACSTSPRPTTACGSHRCIPASPSTTSVSATGFELAIDADVAETRAPTAEELALIREVVDPTRPARDRKCRTLEPRSTPRRAACSASATRSCRRAWATWPARGSRRPRARPAGSASSRRATMPLRRARAGHREGAGAHRRTVRREPARRRRRRRSTRRPARAPGREGRVVRAGAERSVDQAAQGRRRRGGAVGRRAPPRRKGGCVGRRRGARARAARAAATPARCPPRCCCRRSSTQSTSR